MLSNRNFFAGVGCASIRSAPRLLAGVSVALLATTAISNVAVAQESVDSSAADVEGGQTQLDVIVVTAQRRSENIQKVPISISAFDSDALEARGIENAMELDQVEPSLNIASSLVGIASPFMRGIGNNASGIAGNESSVAIYVDDMYYTRLYTSVIGLSSIEQVEVLKGPQGTLFGRNASAGAIQISTRDPGSVTEVDASVGYANYDRISASAYLSTPLSDVLSWNIAAGGFDQRDGYGVSLLTGEDVSLGYEWTVRSKLLWEPGDRTQVKLTGFYAKGDNDIGADKDYLRGTFGGTAQPGVVTPEYPDPPIITEGSPGGFYDGRIARRNRNKVENYGATLRIDHELGFANLVSITGFRNSQHSLFAQTSYDSPDWFNIIQNTKDDQFSQEFQLQSPEGSSVTWILGAYYLHYEAAYNPFIFLGDILNIPFGDGTTLEIFGEQIVDSYSAFGQVTVPLSDRTNITGGLRYTKDDLKGSGSQTIILPDGTVINGQPVVDGEQLPNPFTRSDGFQRVTWKAAIDHEIADDVMVYASVSRGYKGGTYNTIPLIEPPAKAEIVDTYEIGMKADFLDRRLRVNGALFWNDITNPQVITLLSSGATAAAGLINAGSARSRGAELSVNALATEGLEFRVNVAYLDAEYREFDPAPLYTGGTTPGTIVSGPTPFDASGLPLPQASEWTVTGGVNYQLDADPGRLVADVNFTYSSSYSFSPSYFVNDVILPGRTLVNASLEFSPTALDNFTFGLWAKNIGDVQYYDGGQVSDYGFGNSGYRNGNGAPRTYGAKVTFRY